MKKTHTIIISNIGTVYEGTSAREAAQMFKEYQECSRAPFGKVSGETVTHMIDGEPHRTHGENRYRYEYTDTFGGEANYSWVRRGGVAIDGSDPVRAVKAALGLTGVTCRRETHGETIVLYPSGSCTVVFIDWQED